jgi:hypothetical protein
MKGLTLVMAGSLPGKEEELGSMEKWKAVNQDGAEGGGSVRKRGFGKARNTGLSSGMFSHYDC